MKYAIGIDIGGTKISVVLGTEKGKVLARREIRTLTGVRSRTGIGVLAENLKAIIKEAKIPKKNILGIGVGCPGAVDPVKGVAPRSPNLPGWAGIPIKKIIGKATGLPVFLANDANAAAVGESIFGAGRRTNNFVYITVSTGVGGGIVIDGKLYTGASFVAGEIGHMIMVPDGAKCNCGKQGCLEAYASGTAIAKYYRAMTRKKCGAREVGTAAAKGDRRAVESYERAGYYLGIGIANLLNLMNPEKVVIGGGVLKSAHPTFWNAMLQSAKRHAWPEAFHAVNIVRSPLLGRSGELGALALVFQ